MAADEEVKPSEAENKGFFDRLPPRVLYTAFAYPGLGQWRDGDRLKGAVIMLAASIPVSYAVVMLFVHAIRIETCPWQPESVGQLFSCFLWVLHAALGATASVAGICGLGFLGIYLVGVGDAVWVRRDELKQMRARR